jgi:hypothetical protein
MTLLRTLYDIMTLTMTLLRDDIIYDIFLKSIKKINKLTTVKFIHVPKIHRTIKHRNYNN